MNVDKKCQRNEKNKQLNNESSTNYGPCHTHQRHTTTTTKPHGEEGKLEFHSIVKCMSVVAVN